MVVEGHSAGYSLLCQRVNSFHIGLQQVILVFNPVFDEILELLHLNLDDDLVYIRVISCTIPPMGKVTSKAVRVVSRHPVR